MFIKNEKQRDIYTHKDNLRILENPYVVPYSGIYAICDKKCKYIELIEQSECFAGLCWSYHHYSQSPLVYKSTINGNSIRHKIKIGKSNFNLKSSTFAAGIKSIVVNNKDNEIEISYSGLGGGGIGATICRASANGVLRSNLSQYGGEKKASGTIYIPKRFRVLIAVDDTDSPTTGATWTLTYNIAKSISNNRFVFLNQSLVQLYPVPERTQNCMSTVLEFGCITNQDKNNLIELFKKMVLEYRKSENTGILVYSGFSIPKKLKEYSMLCRSQRVTLSHAIKTANDCNVEIVINGNGLIGSLAAFYWFSNPIISSSPNFLKKLNK